MTTAQQGNYNAEAGHLVEFLGRVTTKILSESQKLFPTSADTDIERAGAAWRIYILAAITHKADSLGRVIAAADHKVVKFQAEIMAREFARYLDRYQPDSEFARIFSSHWLQEGLSVFTSLSQRATIILAMEAAAGQAEQGTGTTVSAPTLSA